MSAISRAIIVSTLFLLLVGSVGPSPLSVNAAPSAVQESHARIERLEIEEHTSELQSHRGYLFSKARQFVPTFGRYLPDRRSEA